jgi:glycosyltransferase involved in cell wall biosynthesis
LEPLGYTTVLLTGELSPGEASMQHLARRLDVKPVQVAGLRRSLGLHDLKALWGAIRWVRRVKPQVVHSHTAKAGAIARLAARLTPGHRPAVVIHTFHGHVFEGEFSPRVSRVFARLERALAKRATRIVAVSTEIRQDLIDLGVAPPEKIEVVHLGFDLAPFCVEGEERKRARDRLRQELGIPLDASVVTVVARVTKVKRIDRFLEMATLLPDDVWFVVAGDGDYRAELERSAASRRLGDRVVWAGFQREIPPVCFASDVVVLTSDNEGTPVSLIEAQAAGVPVVTTAVGGVETVVGDGVTGFVVAADARALADRVERLLRDPELRARLGEAGRERSLANFGVERLVADIDGLYRRLLDESRLVS